MFVRNLAETPKLTQEKNLNPRHASKTLCICNKCVFVLSPTGNQENQREINHVRNSRKKVSERVARSFCLVEKTPFLTSLFLLFFFSHLVNPAVSLCSKHARPKCTDEMGHASGSGFFSELVLVFPHRFLRAES